MIENFVCLNNYDYFFASSSGLADAKYGAVTIESIFMGPLVNNVPLYDYYDALLKADNAIYMN